eukprot:scpid28196/ scgid26808/ 
MNILISQGPDWKWQNARKEDGNIRVTGISSRVYFFSDDSCDGSRLAFSTNATSITRTTAMATPIEMKNGILYLLVTELSCSWGGPSVGVVEVDVAGVVVGEVAGEVAGDVEGCACDCIAPGRSDRTGCPVTTTVSVWLTAPGP